jgi:plasmid stabilization system protein ParE
MKFVFLPEAEDDIERLYGFLIEQGNPLAAQKAMLAIDEGIQMLLETPYIGLRMEGRPDYRQLFVPFGKSAYNLRYRIYEEADMLVVVRVWHGRENRV